MELGTMTSQAGNSSVSTTMRKRVRTWSSSAIAMLLLPILITGCSVAQLQAGIEAPNDEVIREAEQSTRRQDNPPTIKSYDRFTVASGDALPISVYARESEHAKANVLMVHGAGSGAWAWEYYFRLLPDEYNLYALSWRGHFDSADVEDADAGDYVEDQTAVLRAIQSRNDSPIHVIGHSYGAATSILQAAKTVIDIESLTLLAPVVPLDYTVAQRIVVPILAPYFIRRSLANGNEVDGIFGGMFLSTPRRRRYFEEYAGRGYSREKPGLIAGDGVSADWQIELKAAYQAVADMRIRMTIVIARYDNVVVPRRQRETAALIGARLIQLESGHYVPLDVEAHASVDIVTQALRNESAIPPNSRRRQDGT